MLDVRKTGHLNFRSFAGSKGPYRLKRCIGDSPLKNERFSLVYY